MSRTLCIEIVETYTVKRKVYVQVEETNERLKDLARYPDLFAHEAQDAAVDKAKTGTLSGWEPFGQPEYEAVSCSQVESAPNVDVIV